MDYLPPQLRLASARLSNFHKNTQRLEIISSSTAGPGTQTTVQLPDNALIDLRSFRMYATVTCTNGVSNAKGATGRLPEHTAYLISKVEVAMNSQQINHGHSEWNTSMKLKRTCERSRDYDGSVDRALHHGAITAGAIVGNEVPGETARLVWSDWSNCFLGSSACQYLDTGLTGSLTLKITWAPANVLVPQVYDNTAPPTNLVALNQGFGTNADHKAAAALISYNVSDIHFDISVVSLDDVYPNMLRQKLAQDGVIEIPYLEFYSFNQDSINSTAFTHQMFLSTRSLDKLYATFRSSNYSTTGVRSHTLPGVVLGDSTASNALRFRSFDPNNAARLHWSVNNVPNPSYSVDNRWSLAELAHMADKHGQGTGNMITSYSSFLDGEYIFPLCLSMPGTPASLTTGLDLRGVNAQVSLRATGITLPTVEAVNQIDATSISCYVLAETKALLKIAPGRVCFAEF